MNVISYTKKGFRWAQWTAADIKKLVPKILEHKKHRYAEIKKIPKDKRTFENTIYAIESSDYDFIDKIYAIVLLMRVSPDESIRNAAKDAIKVFDEEFVEIEYDKGLYRAVKEYKESHGKEKLSPEDKKLFDDMFKSYRRMGFELPPSKQIEVKQNLKKLGKLATDFSNNINEYKDSISVTRDELAGLPENYINGLKRDAKGNFIVTLAYPDYLPFMANAHSDTRRKELNEKYYRKGGANNMKLLEKILELRYRSARLLGYKHHTDYKTEPRMAKNERTVRRFLNGLLGKVKKAAREDIGRLNRLKHSRGGNGAGPIASHEVGYYSEQLKQKLFQINTEEVREYFPLETVKKGTFEIYERLFGVKFKKLSGYPLWHKDVELYVVTDKGRIISYLMFDLYPRENKYGHACVEMLIPGRYDTYHPKTDYKAPIAVMVANFPKPHGKHPSLLSHDEAETFFHEFGHMMHVALTKAPYVSQAGYNVKWDFAEAPSQMLENWVWNKKMLKILSRHYKTGKPLPEKLLNNLLKAKNHMVYYTTVRQLTLGLFDLSIHSGKPPKNIAKLFNNLALRYQYVRMPEGAIFPAGFGHLMGYDAGYYGYMWSKVYAADMFTRFEKEGLLNPRTGRDYRTWILEKGGSGEEMDMVKGFLGRNPNNKAFLKEIGLS